MKKLILVAIAILANWVALSAQEYNTDLNALGQYIQRMYMNEPFEGARVVEDYDNCYLIVIVSEYPTDNEYAMNRKAEVKALSRANEFLNGAQMSQNTLIYTKQNSNGYSYDEIEDFIESRSMGYVQTMQILSTFTNFEKKKVFVYCKQLPMPAKPEATKKSKKRKG